LVYIANTFKVFDKEKNEKKILHSSHVDLEPTSTTPEIKKIIESTGFKYYFTENIETKKERLKKILKMYQDCDYVVTTRLHGAIIAYAFKRPYIAISFDPKITAFHKLYGGGVCITDINQLPAALKGEKFKEKSNYHLELDRVREFGASFR
jgi:polysaccharide pyruvyl transferase WcaK-like protein